MQEHWREAALGKFPEHEEFISSDDEQYGIYNLFFQLRGEFTQSIVSRDVEAAGKILGFAGKCLQGELSSDGEDIGVAAGVSFFEHLFEDVPLKQWRVVFSVMPRSIYLSCRPYAEQWMGAEEFSKLDRNAKEFYG